MNTIIIYYSKYGTTEKCANLLAEKISEGADVVCYADRKNIDLGSYDTVIIGAPVYMGMLKKMKAYCEANLEKLMTKRIGLFVCHMDFDNPIREKMKEFFPKELMEHASAAMGFGGGYQVDKMNKFHKFIFEKVAKSEGSEDKVQYDAIESFAQAFNE